MTHALKDFETPSMGLGCWAIGGPFSLDGKPCGWGNVDDAVSKQAIRTGLDHGIKLFDTAQAYGTGHSETLLGETLKDHPDVAIVTKIGIGIDPDTRQIHLGQTDPSDIKVSIDASRKRLQRDHIDLVLLHLNDLPVGEAEPIFDMLGELHHDGTIGGFGWSTDFPDRAMAFADRPGFVAIEHAMNVFVAADAIVPTVENLGLIGLIRSPLAMGVLGGRYDASSEFAANDVRSQNDDWKFGFKDGRIKPEQLAQLDALRDILSSGGRSLAQGALAWLWARSPSALPIPGFRTASQVTDLCGALDHGPLTKAQMADVETILKRPG